MSATVTLASSDLGCEIVSAIATPKGKKSVTPKCSAASSPSPYHLSLLKIPSGPDYDRPRESYRIHALK
jgi:hypothetical protein